MRLRHHIFAVGLCSTALASSLSGVEAAPVEVAFYGTGSGFVLGFDYTNVLIEVDEIIDPTTMMGTATIGFDNAELPPFTGDLTIASTSLPDSTLDSTIEYEDIPNDSDQTASIHATSTTLDLAKILATPGIYNVSGYGTYYETGIISGLPDEALQFDLQFAQVFGVSAVPLPASAPMFGVALMALGAIGYSLKRTSKAAATA